MDDPYRYPPIEPFNSGYLPVGGEHEIWFEESGAKDGVPVLSLHGGPGAGSDPADRRLFDPKRYRLIQFDQRGCGRSKPLCNLRDNTTQALTADIEILRKHLGIARWLVTGHSWGVCLSLCYALANRDSVTALVLRGVYTAATDERTWIETGWRMFQPEGWARISSLIAPGHRHSYYSGIDALLSNADAARAKAVAVEVARYELTCCYVEPDATVIESYLDPDLCLATAQIQCHYERNNYFLPGKDYLRSRAGELRGIPAFAINGRYDVNTPIGNAWALKQAWPELEVIDSGVSGHMSSEPGNVRAMTALMDRLP